MSQSQLCVWWQRYYSRNSSRGRICTDFGDVKKTLISDFFFGCWWKILFYYWWQFHNVGTVKMYIPLRMAWLPVRACLFQIHFYLITNYASFATVFVQKWLQIIISKQYLIPNSKPKNERRLIFAYTQISISICANKYIRSFYFSTRSACGSHTLWRPSCWPASEFSQMARSFENLKRMTSENVSEILMARTKTSPQVFNLLLMSCTHDPLKTQQRSDCAIARYVQGSACQYCNRP